MNERICVVLITQNNGDAAVRSMVSLERQSYRNFSLTIVDRGSTDDTLKLVRQFLRLTAGSNVKIIEQGRITIEEATLIANQNIDGTFMYVMEPIILGSTALEEYLKVARENRDSKKPIIDFVPFQKRTPANTKKVPFSIFIGCSDYSHWTGMPVYLYRISQEFRKMGHDVTIVSETIGGEITRLSNELGIETYNALDKRYLDKKFDVLLLNEPQSEKYLDEFPNVPAWNYLHSKMEVDTPLPQKPQIIGYLTQRENTKLFWQDALDIAVEVIPLPVDLVKFQPRKAKKDNKYKILVPGTFCDVRKSMVLDIIKRAKKNKNIEVLFKGENTSDYLDPSKLPKNVTVDFTESADLEKYMEWCDEVDGLYEGLITVEAWSMNKKTVIYDDDGVGTLVEKPSDFEEKHSSENVAKKFMELFNRKWADIVIPHHDRPDLLYQALKSIPVRNYNVIVVRGGYFSQSCNKGAKLATTDKIIFANDDLILNQKVLWELIKNKTDIVGVPQYYPSGELLCVGIKIDRNHHYQLTETVEDSLYPSGAIFMVKRKIFEEAGGFDERYKNGGEDQDLFLRLLEKGHKIDFTKGSVIHYCSQSTGRFDYIVESDNFLFNDWTPERLAKIV